MSCNCNTSNCGCSCDITSLPTGADGLNGYNAYTQSTSTFIVPAIGSNNTINVSTLAQYTGEWAATGQVIFIEGAGYYEVVTEGTTSLVVKNLGYPGNALVGINIPAGAKVCPGGLIGAVGATGAAGTNGTNGTNGISIVWLGSFSTAPISPTLNQAYYNTVDGKSYLWNGSGWTIITQDGAQGPAGTAGGLMHYNMPTHGTTTQFLEVPYDATPGVYTTALYFVYPGKLYEKDPKNIKIVAKSTLGEGVIVVDVADVTNSGNWNSTTTIGPIPTTIDTYILSTISLTNVNNNEALIEIQISNTEPDTTVTIYAVIIEFQ